MSPLYIVF